MPVYTTDYAKYRIQIKSLSTKGLIVASMLAIGCTAPLIAQEDITQEDNEQEMVEHEMPEQEMTDQEIGEADQDQDFDSNALDAGDQNLKQESRENQKPETKPEAMPAPEEVAGATQAKSGSPTLAPTAPVAQKTSEPAAAKQENLEASAATQAHDTAQEEAEQPVPVNNAAPEMPALTLGQAAPAPTASKPASGPLAGNIEVAKPAAEPKNGQPVPALVSKNGVEQKPVSPMQSKPAAKPERRAPVKERAEHVAPESEELVGIDTVSLDDPQGNWLFKRIWWERAEKKIEKIRRLVNAVFESRVIFLAQRTDIDRNVLDPFYISIGVGQGELKRILDELIAHLEKEREKEGSLTDQERDILQELRKEESALKQMKTDVENVSRIDHDIDDALNTLFEQINKVREYEADAWDNFKEIARVLNDIKARELYYTMDIIAKNIEDIQAYIQQDYTRHFNQLSTTAKQQIDRLKKSIETMREKGLDLGKKLELLEQEEKMRASGKQSAEQEEEEEPEEQGLFGRYIMTPLSYIGSGLKSLWNGVVSVVAWPINYITGGGTGDSGQEVKEEDED